MRKLLQLIREKIYRQISGPIEELSRLQRVLRYMVLLSRQCIDQLSRDRAAQMAAALTYRTIFSLVPTIILALLVFRAFVTFEDAQSILQERIYTFFEFDKLQLSVEDSQTIQDKLNEFVERGYRLNVASVGGVGLLLLAWAALALVVTVEQCFNRIFNCRTGRPWHIRIMLYWAVLTLGPVLLMISMYLTGRLYGAAASLPIIGVLFQAAGSSAALGASWLLLLLLYVLMPNTHVQLRPAMIGAFVAAILWELGKVGFKFYVTKAVSLSVLYGSLGLVPLFLFWMYLTWLTVLFGLELTRVLQTAQTEGLKLENKEDDRDVLTDSRFLLPVMTGIGDAFRHGRTVTTDALAQQLQLPQPVVARFCRRLHDAGLIHRVGDGGYTLARPAERIAIADLLKLARSLAHLEDRSRAEAPGWALLAELNAVETQAAADRTLADALPRRDPSA